MSARQAAVEETKRRTRERERETLLRPLFLHPRVLTISPRQLRFLFNRARFEVTNYHRRGNSNRPSGCRAACISLRLKDTRLIERDNLMVPCSGIGPESGEKKMRASTSRDFSLSLAATARYDSLSRSVSRKKLQRRAVFGR